MDNRSLSVELAGMTAHNCDNLLAKLAVEGPFVDSDCSFSFLDLQMLKLQPLNPMKQPA